MSAAALTADTVIQNANIITIDPRRPDAQALAIHSGKFIEVGDNDSVRDLVGPSTEVLDLTGKTVVPGFIDAHIHVLSSGVRHVVAADCDQRSIRAVQEALRDRARRLPPGEWIQGFKFDDTKTAENRFLTKQDLDDVSTDRPIFVAHRASHVFYLNSKGLKMIGLTSDSPDPPDGRLGRDPSTGELSGVIYERGAMAMVRPHLPPVTPEVQRQGLRTICRMLNQAGLTSVHDPRVTSDDLLTYQDGRDDGELTLRVYALMSSDHFPKLFPAFRDAGVRSGFGDELLRLGGMKMGVDGAIAARTAYLSEPYIGSEDDHGILVQSPEECESRIMEMHRAGFQIGVHANGDLAIDMVLTAYEKAQAAYPRHDPRHRIEHCTVVNPDILSRMKALGCVATPFCTYVYHHGEKMQFYGEERLEWMFAQRSFIDYGIISTGSTDYPPGPFEPLLGIQSCVTRTDSAGRVWGPSQKVSVEEALRLYTINGAYASFEENLKGSIEVGKLADLVVLGEDPVSVDPMTIKDIPVLRTMVGGNVVYQA